MITLKEIAGMCGVSPSTVSNILNGKTNVGKKTREKVLDVVAKSGYQPNFYAQNMRKQNSRVVAVVTEDLNEFSSVSMVGEIMAHCEEQGYRTVLMNLRLYRRWKDTWYRDEERIKQVLCPMLREILSIRAAGIIYVAGHCRIIGDIFTDLPIPIVFAYGISQNMKYPSVIIDDEKGGYEVTKYIIAKGHRKIGLIGGVKDNLHTKERLRGYQKALSEANISYDLSLVRYGNWRREAGYQEAEGLIKDGVTAIFCMNDNMAAGVYDYIYEKNMCVGKDISVIGYDNKEIADYMHPALTTNDLPLKEIGIKAVQTLLSRMEPEQGGEMQNEMIKIPCRMVERDSVCSV